MKSSHLNERDHSLDLLRGVAIAGMFFFSFVATLSDSLPLLLLHNISGRFLPGDLVLSLFLFTSGISLTLLRSRYKSFLNRDMWRKLIGRLSRMLIVSLIITPFSVGVPLGMDEMMLNLVLTIPALLIIGLGESFIWGAILVIWLSLALLVKAHSLPGSPDEYLGGYRLAFVWLPIVLAGALTGAGSILRRCAIWLVLLVITSLLSGWPDKMSLTPSFGVLSVLVGEVSLWIFRRFNLRLGWLEYFGTKPLQMWVLMFVLLGPLRLYAEVALKREQFSFSPTVAVAISMVWMASSYFISRALHARQEKHKA